MLHVFLYITWELDFKGDGGGGGKVEGGGGMGNAFCSHAEQRLV